jgi:hypothetical protein
MLRHREIVEDRMGARQKPDFSSQIKGAVTMLQALMTSDWFRGLVWMSRAA